MGTRTQNGLTHLCSIALLLSGCMSAGPARIRPWAGTPSPDSTPAALWTHSENLVVLATRPNAATVVAVDDQELGWQHRWVELTPGEHRARVEHRRAGWLCGVSFPLGCYPFLLGIHELTWLAEPGHSYVPFALRHCDNKDWVWIEDTANSASDDIVAAKRTMGLGSPEFMYVVRRAGWAPATPVVAGERPPTDCASGSDSP